ncbi:MAG TPA: efflux RND transporter periplasmic adaptor subunit [Opitutaceae bacterium]|nr:efflux RND transporter periplasmic adaptor subunit [Lacunisphaera sp.]HWA09141.1 efflux RND transporter periplasmic adaptor subunit [Opitutaceae bacterium]
MKLKPLFLFFAVGFSAVAMGFLSACSKADKMAAPDDGVDYYTCSMHPSVKSHDPKAKCPICSMDLTAVMKKGHEHPESGAPTGMASMSGDAMTAPAMNPDQPSEFSIPLDRQQLIGVTYAKVVRGPLQSTIRAVGTVAVDKQRHWDYVTRVDGYIQNLKVFAPGEMVEKGQVLMDIYSPDLMATQNEFLDLLRMRDQAEKNGSVATKENAERLLASARQRLSQWNIGEAQIDALGESRAAVANLQLASPFRGIVETIGVDQGRRVMTGDHLVDVADLTAVWVWAEFYQEELPQIKPGMAVSITSSSLPGEKIAGKIALVDPFLNEMKRTGRVRIDVENPDLKLRPDMYVDVELTLDRGEALTVPINAVLPTGKHNIVFVDKGGGKLEPRFIELGGKFGDVYSVTSGLKEDERVVSSANFLIDAESKVQGALKSW